MSQLDCVAVNDQLSQRRYESDMKERSFKVDRLQSWAQQNGCDLVLWTACCRCDWLGYAAEQ